MAEDAKLVNSIDLGFSSKEPSVRILCKDVENEIRFLEERTMEQNQEIRKLEKKIESLVIDLQQAKEEGEALRCHYENVISGLEKKNADFVGSSNLVESNYLKIIQKLKVQHESALLSLERAHGEESKERIERMSCEREEWKKKVQEQMDLVKSKCGELSDARKENAALERTLVELQGNFDAQEKRFCAYRKKSQGEGEHLRVREEELKDLCFRLEEDAKKNTRWKDEYEALKDRMNSERAEQEKERAEHEDRSRREAEQAEERHREEVKRMREEWRETEKEMKEQLQNAEAEREDMEKQWRAEREEGREGWEERRREWQKEKDALLQKCDQTKERLRSVEEKELEMKERACAEWKEKYKDMCQKAAEERERFDVCMSKMKNEVDTLEHSLHERSVEGEEQKKEFEGRLQEMKQRHEQALRECSNQKQNESEEERKRLEKENESLSGQLGRMIEKHEKENEEVNRLVELLQKKHETFRYENEKLKGELQRRKERQLEEEKRVEKEWKKELNGVRERMARMEEEGDKKKRELQEKYEKKVKGLEELLGLKEEEVRLREKKEEQSRCELAKLKEGMVLERVAMKKEFDSFKEEMNERKREKEKKERDTHEKMALLEERNVRLLGELEGYKKDVEERKTKEEEMKQRNRQLAQENEKTKEELQKLEAFLVRVKSERTEEKEEQKKVERISSLEERIQFLEQERKRDEEKVMKLKRIVEEVKNGIVVKMKENMKKVMNKNDAEMIVRRVKNEITRIDREAFFKLKLKNEKNLDILERVEKEIFLSLSSPFRRKAQRNLRNSEEDDLVSINQILEELEIEGKKKNNHPHKSSSNYSISSVKIL